MAFQSRSQNSDSIYVCCKNVHVFILKSEWFFRHYDGQLTPTSIFAFKQYINKCRRLQKEYVRVEFRLKQSVDIFNHLRSDKFWAKVKIDKYNVTVLHKV